MSKLEHLEPTPAATELQRKRGRISHPKRILFFNACTQLQSKGPALKELVFYRKKNKRKKKVEKILPIPMNWMWSRPNIANALEVGIQEPTWL